MKNYIQKDGYHLKVQVDYEKGGMNYFSGQESKRGYYLYVYPVQIETIDGRVIVESFTLMKGAKKLLFEVNRKSEEKQSWQKSKQSNRPSLTTSTMLTQCTWLTLSKG